MPYNNCTPPPRTSSACAPALCQAGSATLFIIPSQLCAPAVDADADAAAADSDVIFNRNSYVCSSSSCIQHVCWRECVCVSACYGVGPLLCL